MHSSARRLAGVTTLALGLLLSGCGNGSPSSSVKQEDSLAIVAGAQVASQKAGSAKLAMTMDMTISGQSFSISGEGAMDFVKKLGKLSLTMPNPAGGGSLNIDEVMTDTTIYVKSPLIPTGGKPWTALDLKEMLGGSLSQLSAGADPTSGLEMLNGAKSVTKVGTESIRGVQTTHYKAVVDLNKALANKPAAVRAKLESYRKLLGTQVNDYPIEVWIDGKGRPAKFTMTIEVPASTATQNQAVAMTMGIEMFDYGSPVQVTVPPASQVNHK
ncbi:MAG: hypothetical protein QOK42_2527 [Frankiaceae bacterium]|jgi:hypothetical protein|nr:hypothetical protein [Frankiaceae bacterium]